MTDREPETWPAPWVRASLDLAILAVAAGGGVHGYGIAERLAAHGFGRLRGGSLYPVLARLEERGALEAVWQEGQGGPGRRTYALTAEGRRQLTEGVAAWERLGATLTTIAQEGAQV